VVQRILNGDSFDDILDWAIHTDDGYQWAKGIGVTKTGDLTRPELTRANIAKADTIEETVGSLMSAVNLYLPQGVIRDTFAAGGEITQDVLRAATFGQNLPPLRALLIPTSTEARAARTKGEWAQLLPAKGMKVLGSIPETSFARHPLFAAEFHRERRTLLGLAEEQKRATVAAQTGREATPGEGRLTIDEFNKIDLQAHQRAQRTVEQTLFTSSRRSTAGGNAAVRTLFPFVSAYENTLQRWSRFVRADPSIPLRYANNLQKISQGVVVVDEDGNEIENASDWDLNSMLVLPGLKDLHLPGRLGRTADLLSKKTHVPLKSLDVAFQGQLDPGLGPLMVLPMVEIVRNWPSTEQMFKWAMPYGVPESNWDIFLSTAQKRGLALWTDSGQVSNTFSKAALIAQYRHEEMGEPMPSMEELKQATQSMFLMRMVVALGAPFATTFTNDRDFFAAKLREYQDIAIADAVSKGQPESVGYDIGETNFYLDHPDATLLVESLSKNPYHLRSGAGVVDNAKRYPNEIADAASKSDPEVAGFVANYDVGDQDAFSQAAYQWERTYGPLGSNEGFRQQGDPNQQVYEAHVRDGWRIYRQYIDQAQADLAAEGADPHSDYYQDVMKGMKAAAVQANVDAGNRDWENAFGKVDNTKYERRADAFKALLNDTKFSRDHERDTLIQTIRLFLARRDEMQQILTEFKKAKEAGQTNLAVTLDADANIDLKKAWDAGVDELKAQSPEFAAWHSTFFISDSPAARREQSQ
jgi:hypothetical protein